MFFEGHGIVAVVPTTYGGSRAYAGRWFCSGGTTSSVRLTTKNAVMSAEKASINEHAEALLFRSRTHPS